MTTQLIAVTCAVRKGSDLTAFVDGELDFHTCGQIGPRLMQLARSCGPVFTLDLYGLTFCDSSGIDLLLRIHEECAASGTRLRLARVPHLMATSMRVLGADRVLLSQGRTSSTPTPSKPPAMAGTARPNGTAAPPAASGGS